MSASTHTPRGTTHIDAPLEVAGPTGDLTIDAAPVHEPRRWQRRVLILVAITTALLLLLGAVALV